VWKFLLRFRVILWIARFILFPLLVFFLLFFVLGIIGVSLYLHLLTSTIKKVPENPYLFLPALLIEIFLILGLAYLSVVYINKILKKWR